jgi:hypothetical protein
MVSISGCWAALICMIKLCQCTPWGYSAAQALVTTIRKGVAPVAGLMPARGVEELKEHG